MSKNILSTKSLCLISTIQQGVFWQTGGAATSAFTLLISTAHDSSASAALCFLFFKVLIPQPVKNCELHPASAHTPLRLCSSAEPPEWNFTASEDSWLPSVPINTQKRAWTHVHGVKRQLGPTDHEPFSRGFDHESFSRMSDHEPYSQTSDHKPFLRGSENSLFSRPSDCAPYSRTSDQEPFSRGSENDPFSGSSVFDPYSRTQEPYSKSSDHVPYSSCSENNAFSGSSDHEPFSRGSENEPFSSCSENDSFSGSFEHEPSGENSVNRFVGERARKILRDPKRLKLELDLLQQSSKQLSSDSERSDQVPPKSAEDSPSHKANLSRLLNAEMIQVYGAFHGLKVVVARHHVTSDLSDKGAEEAMCFKTSIRDHSTVRTNVFPHGKTFTSLTPDGSCRFLWVPDQN